jgi:cytochrome b subunit of formate dehydrogenase
MTPVCDVMAPAGGGRQASLAWRVLALLLLLPAAAAQDDACLECHARDGGMLADGGLGTTIPPERLLLDGELFARSVHAGHAACADCHLEREDFPHPADAPTLDCTGCHADQAAAVADSVHGTPTPDGRRGAGCTDCHGVHDVLPADQRESRLYPLNVYRTCGACHSSVDVASAPLAEVLHDPYTDDTHAKGILKSGLTVTANCVSCHGGHEVHAAGDPASPLARARVDQVCGECHVGVAEEYRGSVHALEGAANGHAGATCTDCHRPHEVDASSGEFLARTSLTCTGCHAERGGSFRLSYHGKVTLLGSTGTVATCASCHGNHAVLPEDDPASLVHVDNRLATCRQCHPEATASFTGYVVHADPTDGEKFPELNLAWRFMNGLLVCVLALGGLHAVLWLVRATADGHWKRHKPNGRWVRRWPTSYVVFHAWMVLSVLTLASTGFPLHFADQPWAAGLMRFFGGTAAAGWVHRAAAVSLGLLYATYIASLFWRKFGRKERNVVLGPDTLLPRFKDVQDLLATLRWFFFLAPRPRYDRWTYWEKFDFWAATWGLLVIGVSGLMLWFPEKATLLVPGWMLNVAVIIHGIEALLDIAFIFTVHVFHANLRPDKFPLDTMVLTGRIPEHEFAADRPLVLERARRAGALGALAAEPPTRALRTMAYVLGAAALGVGFFFVAAMIVAVATGT